LFLEIPSKKAYSLNMLSYDLELDFPEQTCVKTYSHNREGFTAALEEIERVKPFIQRAVIISSRDGEVFSFSK